MARNGGVAAQWRRGKAALVVGSNVFMGFAGCHLRYANRPLRLRHHRQLVHHVPRVPPAGAGEPHRLPDLQPGAARDVAGNHHADRLHRVPDAIPRLHAVLEPRRRLCPDRRGGVLHLLRRTRSAGLRRAFRAAPGRALADTSAVRSEDPSIPNRPARFPTSPTSTEFHGHTLATASASPTSARTNSTPTTASSATASSRPDRPDFGPATTPHQPVSPRTAPTRAASSSAIVGQILSRKPAWRWLASFTYPRK